jgi:hypothetical protein
MRLRSLTTLIKVQDGIELHVGYDANRSCVGIHLTGCKRDADLDRRIDDALETAQRDLFPAIYLHD